MPCKNIKPVNADMAADRWLTGLVGGCIVLAMLYYAQWHLLIALIGAFLVWECTQAFPQAWLKVASLAYVSIALVCLWDAPWIFLPLVWANDTGAYLVGSWLKGPKLCPSISPGKTWSGLLGGLICGAAVFQILSIWLGTLPEWSIGMVCFFSLAGHLGDLVESWAKRRAGIKDTAHYLPGHGGFLDRFDSLLGMGLAYALNQAIFF